MRTYYQAFSLLGTIRVTPLICRAIAIIPTSKYPLCCLWGCSAEGRLPTIKSTHNYSQSLEDQERRAVSLTAFKMSLSTVLVHLPLKMSFGSFYSIRKVTPEI
jgi:hypothetical protein